MYDCLRLETAFGLIILIEFCCLVDECIEICRITQTDSEVREHNVKPTVLSTVKPIYVGNMWFQSKMDN